MEKMSESRILAVKIDNFMLRTGKIPKQTEFKNENGLPSYGAAGRALEMSPAEYMRERYDALGIETKQDKATVRLTTHRASNADRQSRSGGCGLKILVRFWVRYARFTRNNADCVRSYHGCGRE